MPAEKAERLLYKTGNPNITPVLFPAGVPEMHDVSRDPQYCGRQI
ncbi:MAG TPA: hypothetical protein VN658_05745 [Candidatus Acidoferrales bacterium]|nr:hypothetical protein [Candidatus Acidoferrales bacterium]